MNDRSNIATHLQNVVLTATNFAAILPTLSPATTVPFIISAGIAGIAVWFSTNKKSKTARAIARYLGADPNKLEIEYILKNLNEKSYPELGKKILSICKTGNIEQFAQELEIESLDAWEIYLYLKDVILDHEFLNKIEKLVKFNFELKEDIASLRSSMENEISKFSNELKLNRMETLDTHRSVLESRKESVKEKKEVITHLDVLEKKIDEKLEKIFERLKIPDKIEPDEKKKIPVSITSKIQMLIKEKNKLKSGLKDYDVKIQKQKELSMKLANIFYFQRKYKKAIKMYDDLLKIYPSDFYTLCNKGATLSRIGKHDEALDYFTKALKIDPTDAYAWRHKAVIHLRLNELKLGLKCMDKAMKINPRVNDDLRILYGSTKFGRRRLR